ncbi:uncharacterized protein LOC124258201 [Haliotis rubra]|uniref:uncharacterized protein LOC124258201 n=1 Tax=Haliotis rubra TaxID=36100 RepID=UPI001EE5847F|nr:uncharacterized protein LOC124258201 [Haliotis rubra]
MVVSSIPIAMAVIGIKALLDPKVTCHFMIELYLAAHGLYSVLVLFVSCLNVCGICVCSDKTQQRCHGLMAYFYIGFCFEGAYAVAGCFCEGQIYNEALAFLIVMWIVPFIIICLVAAIIDEN